MLMSLSSLGNSSLIQMLSLIHISDGVVVTLGGQTPLKLARMLEESGVNIMGTKPDAIDFAEDRERFAALLDKLGIMYPPAGQK